MDEYQKELVRKLKEETEELSEALDKGTNTIEELADIAELLIAIAEYKGSNQDEIEKTRRKKLVLRGGFRKRIMLLGKVAKG